MDIPVPPVTGPTHALAEWRTLSYRTRLAEYSAFRAVHEGQQQFAFTVAIA